MKKQIIARELINLANVLLAEVIEADAVKKVMVAGKVLQLNNAEKKLMNSLEIGHSSETITNPYSEHSCLLEPEAVAVYDFIKGAESIHDSRGMRLGLELFRKNWPKEYLILLD